MANIRSASIQHDIVYRVNILNSIAALFTSQCGVLLLRIHPSSVTERASSCQRLGSYDDTISSEKFSGVRN